MAAGEIREIKVTGIRKLIADRMLASLQTTAQLTMHTAADARSLQSMRKKFKDSPEPMGLRAVTINDMVLYAVARVLTRFPEMNALFVGDTLRQHSSVHLGFAVDTPRGLMVPVIRDAHARSLRETASEAARLIAGCRDGGIRPEEMAGGTFTVTNLGTFGVHGFTPVLNAPQVGILGVGAIVPGPVQDRRRARQLHSPDRAVTDDQPPGRGRRAGRAVPPGPCRRHRPVRPAPRTIRESVKRIGEN